MKRLIVILCTTLITSFAWAGIHSYATQSALKSGTIIKIQVSETGVHAIPYDSLITWGLNADQVCILGYGGAVLSENFTLHHWDDLPSVPFYMHKGSDNVFNSGDYILFYAQGAIQWECGNDGIWKHTQNPYSNYGYYFVTDNAELQKQIELSQKEYSNSNVIDVDWYTSYQVHEIDSVNLIDPSGVNGGGREFYGEKMNSKIKRLDISFPMQNVRSDIYTRCQINLAAYAGEITPIQIEYAGTSTTYNIPGI